MIRRKPNPAFSGRGFAARQPEPQKSGQSSPAEVLDKHAAPLTPSLGGQLKGKQIDPQIAFQWERNEVVDR